MRLRAYSLFFSLIISVLVFMIINSFVIESLQFNHSKNNYRSIIRNGVNAMSGIYYALSSEIEIGESQQVQLFENDRDLVRIQKKQWGAFEVITSITKKNGYAMEKTALVGSQMELREVLILSNLNRPLALSGSTKITGDCILPKAGVKRAYIEGQSYSGKKLINGLISYAQSQIELDLDFFQHNPYINGDFSDEDSVIIFDGPMDSLIQPFFKNTIVVILPNEQQPIKWLLSRKYCVLY